MVKYFLLLSSELPSYPILIFSSYESGILERVEQAPPKELWTRTVGT